MLMSRRELLSARGAPGAALSPLASLVAARGLEAAFAEAPLGGRPILQAAAPGDVRIGGNENPLGPGQAALEALVSELDQVSRYPFNSRVSGGDLLDALLAAAGVTPQHITIGAGSSEILSNAVRLSGSPDRPVVTGGLSYGSPITACKRYGYPWRSVPLDADLRLDLAAMADAARGAGMVYLCNPNNPTATLQPAAAIERFITDLHDASPETLVLVDEAYHEYATDPAHRTLIPFAMDRPNVVVARTFSKAYGMAGLRLGYGVGHPETIAPLRRHQLSANANVLAIASAVASLADPGHIERERARNTAVRRFTTDFFDRAGFRSTESQTNFMFVELGRPAAAFRGACAKQRVFVARDFPPMERTHCRISFGTMDEMRRACQVFAEVLGVELSTAVAV